MTTKINDTYEDIAAIRPCGCVAMIMVVRRPARGKEPAYEATPKDMADFYRDVSKATTRKKKPLTLKVVTLKGGAMPPWQCGVCRPQRTLLEAAKESVK